MAGIKTLGGDSSIAPGWVQVSVTTAGDGTKTVIFRGGLDKFDKARAVIATRFSTAGDISESKDPATGTGEITVSGQNIDPSGSGTETDTELVTDPSCALQGQMVSLPLYQAPYFNFGTDVTIQDLRYIDTCIRDEGTITLAMIGGRNAKVQEYAQWLFAGQKNYMQEAYSLSITLHFLNNSGQGAGLAQGRILTPGTVIQWSTIWSKTKIASKFRPPEPGSMSYWLPFAPSVHVSASEAVLTQTFYGAAKFPNYYTDGTWTPPPLDGKSAN